MKYSFLLIIISWPFNLSAQVVNDETILTNSTQFQNVEEETIWKTYTYELIDSTALEDHEVFYPHALTINDKLDVAIMAWDQREVYVFENGSLSNSKLIATSRGRGPKEYESPFDMYLSNENLLWITDIDLRKIDVWDVSTSGFKDSFKIKNRFIKPDQIVTCENDISDNTIIYILSSQYGLGHFKKEGMLHKYEYSNGNLKALRSFQKLSKEEEMYPYVMTGDVACNDKGELIYSGDYTGSIRHYDKEGKILYYRTAADNVIEEPLFFDFKDGTTRVNPGAPKINGEIYVTEDNQLYVSRSRNDDRFIYGVDVYTADTGLYEYSFNIPNISKEIAIVGDKLIAVEFRGQEGYDLKIYAFEAQ